jgi:streptogramin lyase
MKKKYLLGLLTLALAGSVSLSAQAQEKKKTVGQTIDKTASNVGNKTAEVAVKGVSKVGDKTYKGKVAPDGTDVYIDGKNRKYYVNKKGGKVYLKASQIRNKPVK